MEHDTAEVDPKKQTQEHQCTIQIQTIDKPYLQNNKTKHNLALGFNCVTWALLTTTPVAGFANNTTFGLTILLITRGSDHLNNSLADVWLALSLFNFKQYLTVSHLKGVLFAAFIVPTGNCPTRSLKVSVGS
jgi:hypothetical protein